MIKVKIDRPTDNVFYVEDGITVNHDATDNTVLEVLDEDDSVIAVFRDWIYALPITDEDYLLETENLEEDAAEEVAPFEAPDTASYVHANSHGQYVEATDETADPTA